MNRIYLNSSHLYRTVLTCLLLITAHQASAAAPTTLNNKAESAQQKMPAMHHPVDIEIPESMELPDKFKADKNNKLRCTSCHGIEDIKNQNYDEVDKSVDNFLIDGPYLSMGALNNFCNNCHESKSADRLNIHKQINEQGSVDDSHCEYCHKKTPDLDGNIDWTELEFQKPLSQLCWGCHLQSPHFNVFEHSQKPDKKMIKQIKKTQEQQVLLLPLDESEQVSCITCHTPHEKGVLNSSSPGAQQVAEIDVEKGIQYIDAEQWAQVNKLDKQARLSALKNKFRQAEKAGQLMHSVSIDNVLHYKKIDKEVLLRLPAKNGQLCESCHLFKD